MILEKQKVIEKQLLVERSDQFLALNDKDEQEENRRRLALIQESINRNRLFDASKPHLANLNEDPQLNKILCHSLAQEKTTIGRKEDSVDITLNGIGVQDEHCYIQNFGGRVTLTPCEQSNYRKQPLLYRNGILVEVTIELENNDRIFIGTSAAFLVKIPSDVSLEKGDLVNKGGRSENPCKKSRFRLRRSFSRMFCGR